MNKKILSFFPFILFLTGTKAQQASDPDYIRSHISYTNYYPFIDTGLNFIQYFTTEAIRPFFEKLKKSNTKKITILHIGDSHLQADIGAGYSRNKLQEVFGFGGRGSIFPYAVAQTHAPYDYTVRASGNWQYSKNIDILPKFNIGITGIAGRTYDSAASFQIDFYPDRAKIQPDFKKLKLFCYTGFNSFDCEYRLNSDEEWQQVSCQSLEKERSCIELSLPEQPSSIYFRVLKKDSSQKYFEINGLSLESITDKGILYNSVGINGARLKSLLKENLYELQINEFNPDLIILDLIANDLAYGDFDKATVESDLKNCLHKLRTASPDAVILVVGMQDIYLKGRNIINAGLYSEYLAQFAALNNVAFYDYYTVSGGRFSMKKWKSNTLCAKDECHLSPLGYNLKGQLFSNAILKSYLNYLTNDSGSLIVNKSIPATPIMADEKDVQKINTKTVVDTKEQTALYKSPDKTYPDKSSKKAVLNKKSEKISVAKSSKKGTLNKNPGKTSLTENTSKKPILYKVKKGDSFYSIAQKYKTDVSKIMKINKIVKNNIQVGQIIRIPQ